MLSSFLSLIETTGSSVQISVQRKQQNKTEIGIKILKFFLSSVTWLWATWSCSCLWASARCKTSASRPSCNRVTSRRAASNPGPSFRWSCGSTCCRKTSWKCEWTGASREPPIGDKNYEIRNLSRAMLAPNKLWPHNLSSNSFKTQTLVLLE